MKRSRLNPPLEVGDEIILLASIEDQVPAGTKGVVKNISEFLMGGDGSINYHIEWENGSSLAMLSDVDSWTLSSSLKIKDNIKEHHFANDITKILEDFKFTVLKKFLGKLQNSGIINMFGAAPYLYMGRERIESIHKYDSIAENKPEEFEEMLELSDLAKDEMIRGTVKKLEDSGKEWDVDDVNREISRNAQNVLKAWIAVHQI
jgi:hypothetical protein